MSLERSLGLEIFRGTELRVSGCVQVENTDKKFRERIMNPGGARRGRGRECKPVGPSIHSMLVHPSYLLPGDSQSQNISIHAGMVARGTTLPPLVHYPLLPSFIIASFPSYTAHSTPSRPPFHEKESACEWSQGYESRRGSWSIIRRRRLLLRSKRIFDVGWQRFWRAAIFFLHPFKFKVPRQEDFFYLFCRMKRRESFSFLFFIFSYHVIEGVE